MRSILHVIELALVTTVAVAACSTERNPNLCCTDEAECSAVGLTEPTACASGLVCRGSQCVAEVCDDSAQCDASAPYCVFDPDGRCQEACTEDAQCPGFGQSSSEKFCETGSCVSCRAAMNDCPASAPVCEDGTCRRCERHDECPEGVCGADGACAAATEIAFVDPSGPTSASCSRATPCSVAKALSISPPRRYLVFAPGRYESDATITVGGRRTLIGTGPMRPVLATSLSAPNGPVLRIDSNSDVLLEFLEISGARGAAPDGNGIECGSSASGHGSRTLRLLDVVATNNSAAGVSARGCNVVAMHTKFEKNVGSGIEVYDAIAEIDGCEAISNSLNGFTFDYGSFVLTNSIAARNGATGVEAFTPESGTSRFEHNTISDNQTGASSDGGVFANNLIVRNRDANLSCSGCTQDGNLILGSDIAAVRFVSPDVLPYNYRLMPGSIAIDAATNSAIDHDIDGDPRPTGAGRDVGADELAP